MIKYLFIFTIALLSISSIKAQEPSYSVIGENEFAGLDIYTLAQDKNNFIWLGTEDGLYRYNGYEFKKYVHKNLKAKSIFGFTHDNFNNLFCFNLSGQVIKIEDDTIQLFFQIPDSLLTSFYEIGFDSENNLVIAGDRPFWIDKHGKTHLFFDYQNTSFMASFKRLKHDLFFSTRANNEFSVVRLKKGEKPSKINFDKKATSPLFTIQNKNNYTIIKERDDFNFYDFDDGNIVKHDFNLGEITANHFSSVSYVTSDSTLWQTTRRGGSIALNKNAEKPFHKKILFNEYYISSYLEDHEGNLWLATLGKGLLFVPNINFYSYQNIPELEKEVFTKIISNNETIWVATQSGKIIEFINDKPRVIFNQNNTKISLLKFDKNNNQLIFNGSIAPVFLNLNNGKTKSPVQFGSVKDVAFINDTLAVFTTNTGISFFNTKLNKVVSSKFILPKNIGRTSGICYQNTENKIWVSTLKGLMILSEKNNPIFFDSIYSVNSICEGSSVWVATKDNGVYEFLNSMPIKHLNTKSGLISNVIYNIKILNNELYIAHERGLQIINLKTNETENYDKTDGLFINRITDFTVKGNIIWLITNKGIQFFTRKEIRKNELAPNIIINKVLVNNAIGSTTITKTHEFNYNENNIEISFTSTSFHHQGLLKYAFKINEINDKWQYRNFNENKVYFTALKPGKYTFTLKAINENNIESTPITYQFIIRHPFWATWWFYTIIVIIFIAITIVIYRFQLKKQQKKIELENELNMSKLIAIQSQMNPHFIFNAINSIQDLILQGNIDKSYSYVIKFSKLVRQTLNFSDKEFIDIEEEIELLSIYLELEKLRFKDDFEYQINMNNAEDIQVPPMLIQPFVENAIKHGLLHKEGVKRLEVTFNLNNTLHCKVCDNGVGRKKAQEIKQRQQKNIQSFSVNAIKKRFEIMNNQYQNEFSVTYSDLMNNETPIGTEVYISMPFKRNY